MKVENPFGSLINQVEAKKTTTQKADGTRASFSEILEGAKATKAHETKPLSAPGELTSPMGLSDVQKNAISRSEETLTILNHLAGLLEKDPNSSSMQSLVGALDSSSNELMALDSKLDPNDPLRNTINEINILSVVEKIKITRGDYT